MDEAGAVQDARPAMAPNISPPGNLNRRNATAQAVATIVSTIIWPSTARSASPRGTGIAGTTRPNSASPFGRPTTSKRTRTVCTIAMRGDRRQARSTAR